MVDDSMSWGLGLRKLATLAEVKTDQSPLAWYRTQHVNCLSAILSSGKEQ